MLLFTVDVSEFNPVVDDSYKRHWFSFRLCDGDHVDNHVLPNFHWAMKHVSNRQLVNFSGYVVYRPGMNSVILNNLKHIGFPANSVLMIDAESWGGDISGDHSAEINELYRLLFERQGKVREYVWGYGNRGPDAEVWPAKPVRMPWLVASYGGSKPDIQNMAGWQYTNGNFTLSAARKNWPRRSAPFGKCDHNALFITPKPY